MKEEKEIEKEDQEVVVMIGGCLILCILGCHVINFTGMSATEGISCII